MANPCSHPEVIDRYCMECGDKLSLVPPASRRPSTQYIMANPSTTNDALARACEGKRNSELTPEELKARTAVALRKVKAELESPEMAAALGVKLTIETPEDRNLARTLCPTCDYPAKPGETYCCKACEAKAAPLARAIEALGAIEVAPGRYAVKGYEADGSARWNIVPEADLTAPTVFEAGRMNPSKQVRMPSWWSPERRFAIRANQGREIHGTFASKGLAEYCSLAGPIITADLNTGAEVPA